MEVICDSSVINWTPETEVCLFYAMRGQKPTGMNKHFHMLCIHKNFCQSLGQTISTDQIWDRLHTMYNLKALDEAEINRIKNVKQEFKLPAEIINYRTDQSNVAEDSGTEGLLKAPLTLKLNRKRIRNSPAPIPNKRRR